VISIIPAADSRQQKFRPSTSEGPLSLVLLPGLDGTGVTFAPLLEALPTFIRPVVITYPQDRAMGYEELLPLVMGMLPNSPFILLGESFASPLAIMIAAEVPPGLRGLILCSAFARNPLWLAPNWVASLAHPLFFRLYSPYVRFKWWRRGGGPLANVRLSALCQRTPQVIAKRVQSVLRVNVMRQLSACHVPVLYVRGDRDRLIHRRNLSEMSECLPSMRRAELDGGHCVLRSRPALAAAAIVEFINSCDWQTADASPAARETEEALHS
jgi:pimeloyl-ACP methyl ester carboxylesterase